MQSGVECRSKIFNSVERVQCVEGERNPRSQFGVKPSVQAQSEKQGHVRPVNTGCVKPRVFQAATWKLVH